MAMNNPQTQHTSASDLWRVLKGSPALLLVSVGAIGVVAYMLYKTNSSNQSVAQPASSQQSPYYVAYIDQTQNQPPPVNVTVNNPPQPAPAPTPTPTPAPLPKPVLFPQSGFIRARYTGITHTYDVQNPQGVPIRSSPSATSILRYVMYGTKITVTGPAVKGGSNFGGSNSGSTEWFPVSGGGFISAYDVTGIQVS
ncbi:MAG TPA: hypothetical protein VFK47_10870 [Ktedonobacteraceae bacterium]|nr:hypothetical protein [Ktedonobacteraceae bacterium]